MDRTTFMNQPVKDMSFEELLKAMSYKLKESKEESPQTELKVGDTVEIVQSYENGKDYDGIVGKTGELIELRNEKKYKYRVKFKSERKITEAYKVKKVEKITKPKEEKKTLSDEIKYPGDVPSGAEIVRVDKTKVKIERITKRFNEETFDKGDSEEEPAWHIIQGVFIKILKEELGKRLI